MLKSFLVIAVLHLIAAPVQAAGPAKTKAKPTAAVQKRAPSNTKATCSEQGCACDDLSRQTNFCAAVLSPADSGPRNNKSMRDCYLNLVQKRRLAMAARASCGVVDRSTAQIEDLRVLLARVESQSKDQHVSSNKGLEGFGLDLVGHLDGNYRTPASGN